MRYLILLIVFGCTNNSKKILINPSDVIIQAVVISYSDLDSEEKENLIYTKCCCYPSNWNHGVDCVEKEYAFYVKAKINVYLLASLSESRTFPKSHLISSNPHFLYGKYVNRWDFKDEMGYEICKTSKNNGHNYFNLVRNDSVDHLIIGPLPKQPKKMLIEILDSKNYPGLTPEYEF